MSQLIDTRVIEEAISQFRDEGYAIVRNFIPADEIERLQEKTGGFGCYLFLGADLADWHQTLRSYELFAEQVMPHFKNKIRLYKD